MDPGSFCKSAYELNEIRLKSSGKQSRDFIDLQTIATSVKHIIENYRKGFSIYNITTESLFTISELARLVHSIARDELNKNIDLIYENKMPIESNKFRVSNNLLGPVNKTIIYGRLRDEIKKTFILFK